MSNKIKLVQGDNRPYIKLTLKNSDGSVMNLTNATVSVALRAAGDDVVLSTIQCTVPNGGSDGVAVFNFPNQTLDVEPGEYEGEIKVSFSQLDDDVQTVYDVLKFTVRAKFA
ncbi:MAG: BppU family phage baseplate upper protein [Burkholderiales bacterium]